MPNKRKLKKEESNSEFENFLSNLNNSSFKDEQYERIKSICDLKLADNALNATELWIKNLNPLEVFKMKNVENEDEDDEKRQWKNRCLPDLSEEDLKEYDERIELGHEQLKFFKNTVKVISVSVPETNGEYDKYEGWVQKIETFDIVLKFNDAEIQFKFIQKTSSYGMENSNVCEIYNVATQVKSSPKQINLEDGVLKLWKFELDEDGYPSDEASGNLYKFFVCLQNYILPNNCNYNYPKLQLD